jgi:leucyl/phenylalanyl-tRNA--protein transferase
MLSFLVWARQLIKFQAKMKLMKSLFPDPRQSTPEGLVAVGGDLSVNTLKDAYSRGIFPWPQEGLPMLWFSPDPRGVLDFSELHVGRSLQKWLKANVDLKVTCNQATQKVIQACRQKKRPGQAGTWILPEMETAYTELNKNGWGISIEIWREENLVGGIYGVLASAPSGKYFSAESMFYSVSNASKLALLELVRELKKRGLTWMDLQMVTDVSSQFGAKLISRDEFLKRLGV